MPPTSRKARWACLAAALFAMLSVGASRSETVQAPNERIVKVAGPTRVVTKTKVVTKIVREPARPPSGFVTVDDCKAIKVGMVIASGLLYYLPDDRRRTLDEPVRDSMADDRSARDHRAPHAA